MLVIRPFKRKDFRVVLDIEKRSFLDGDPLLYMELYELYPDGFLVAEVDGRIVGFIIAILTMDGEGRIFSIAVDEGYRRKGIGTALLNSAFEILKEKGVDSVRLEVRVTNHPAQSLYRKLGFVDVGFIPNYYRNGEDAIVMRKKL
ncbi:MAG: ribosomal protein S18-alanine N-acetyltransferase [Candidatus Syntropharchaeia archaeon]